MVYLIIGLIIGIFIGVWVNSYEYIKNNLVKFIVAIVAIILFIFVIYNKLNIGNNESLLCQNYEILLTFFSSFIFSWILNEFSSVQQLKEREKDLSIKSFRHSRNLISKIEYSILISDMLNENSSYCSNNGKIECKFFNNLNRIRDLLITFKKDANEIKNDWSDIISEDIICYKEIEQIDDDIKKLLPKTQDERNTYLDIEIYLGQIEELNDRRKVLENKLDKRVKLALDEQIKLDDEVTEFINTESKINYRKKHNIEPKEGIAIPKKNEFRKEKKASKANFN
ncbi:hypothetical protein [Caminicella sporogenes]|uniref:hypothetical protein n=1 Tax=Caminicella sporogenes TaxID=166485 RepID=UPI0025402578|nr:hypothetical protein [Caminicella sporogenes]WIF95000.1 hypothetical protein QNI18_12180 [Caminicella sporogenes]WIF95105.1 hypothetical protein QNI18_00255 [Caminicella sporogenes]